jgi:hypothetical protein
MSATAPQTAIGNILAARVAAAQRPPQAQAALAPAYTDSMPASGGHIRTAGGPGAGPQIVPAVAVSAASASAATPAQASSTASTASTASASPAPAIADLDARFRQATTRARAALWEMVYYGYRLALAADWQKLGHESAESYIEQLGISPQTWLNYMVLGERLEHLTLAEMQGLKLGTMTQLAKVRPELWQEYAWVEEAKALPPRDFAMIVAQRNRDLSTKPLAEPRADVRVSMPISQQVAVARRLDQIRRKQQLATTGDALIVAVAAVDRAALLEDTLSEVKQRVAELERLWRPDQPGLAGMVESEAEKAARLDRGETALSDAAARTQQLTRMLLKDLREVEVGDV